MGGSDAIKKFFPYVVTVLSNWRSYWKQLRLAYINALGNASLSALKVCLYRYGPCVFNSIWNGPEISSTLLMVLTRTWKTIRMKHVKKNFNKTHTCYDGSRQIIPFRWYVCSKKTGEPYLFAKTTTNRYITMSLSPPMLISCNEGVWRKLERTKWRYGKT